MNKKSGKTSVSAKNGHAAKKGVSPRAALSVKNAKSGRAKMSVAKAGAVKTGPVKNGAVRTGTAKNGIARNGIAKTGVAKAAVAKTGVTRSGGAKSVLAKSLLAKNGIRKNGHGKTNGHLDLSGHKAIHLPNPVAAAAAKRVNSAGEAAARDAARGDGYQPTDKEPFMNERQREYFRQKLQIWRDEILREVKETRQHLQDENQNHPDIADRASSETDRAIELRARDRQRKLISKIDAALTRIDDGTYGFCEETGEPIGIKRLEARPIATLSVEAQERHERRERVYRDD